MEERIFEKCVDAKLLADPETYCARFLVNNLNLTLWNNATKYKTCDEGGDAMEKKCE